MNILTYKGYAAAVEFDADDLTLVGRIAGINDVIGFHGENPKAMIGAFHEAVEDYLESCAKVGKDPERPYSGKVMLRVDPKVHQKAARAAQLAGISLNQFGEEALKRAAEQAVREPIAEGP